MEPSVIEIHELTKTYQMGKVAVQALRGITLQIRKGEMMSIMGASGSGKSTLMNVIGCLDKPTSGRYLLEGQDVGLLDDNRLADIRNRQIGFVFQTFNLLARTNALHNVMLPMVYSGLGRHQRRERAQRALEVVGLADRLKHAPNELSGGQQQRVAIARALVNEPSILLADEPTGNLDSRSGAEIMALLQELNRRQGITVVLVTHDPLIARHTQRVVHLHDGTIDREEPISDPVEAAAGRVDRDDE